MRPNQVSQTLVLVAQTNYLVKTAYSNCASRLLGRI